MTTFSIDTSETPPPENPIALAAFRGAVSTDRVALQALQARIEDIRKIATDAYREDVPDALRSLTCALGLAPRMDAEARKGSLVEGIQRADMAVMRVLAALARAEMSNPGALRRIASGEWRAAFVSREARR